MTNEQLDALVERLRTGGWHRMSDGQAFIDDAPLEAADAITTIRARAEAAEADAERLAEALASVIAACRQARMTTKSGHGIGGMTIEAKIRGSQYNGVSAWPIEEADEVLSAHNERMNG